MAERQPEDENQYQFYEPAYTGRSMIYQRLLLGDNPTVGMMKFEMLHVGMLPEEFDDSLADMTATGKVEVDQYTTELSFYRQAPFN